MTAEEYQTTVASCALVGSMLTQYDLPKILQMIGRAETVGPMVDPTLWIKKHEAMGEDKKLLEAALPLWRWAKEQQKIAERRLASTSGAAQAAVSGQGAQAQV